jgi:8-oxo-dGTP pyrophosphatase MutT (NUDIX family)
VTTVTEMARFPVSIKGVVLTPGPSGLSDRPRVALLENERGEWELPGGKLELGETPEACLVREIREELGLMVRPGPLLDVWVYRVRPVGPETDVLIVTYGCHAEPLDTIHWTAEHRGGLLASLDELARLPMPEGYRRSIRAWAATVGGQVGAS